MDSARASGSEPVPEHVLALLYGIAALLLGAAVWSAIASLSTVCSLIAAPGLGWMVGWACLHGGRREDTFIRTAAWVLAAAAPVLALFAQSAFTVAMGSPDSEFQIRAALFEWRGLFAEPPWSGTASVLLALAGASRALRQRWPRTVIAWHREVHEERAVTIGAPVVQPPSPPTPGHAVSGHPGSRAA